MDINWCKSATLSSWDNLRATFKVSNGRKAIAPTQFNHQSTRGHCIMTLEVAMPKPDNPAVKQRGRVYVCDLAGTEPAGDIVYASYKKIKYPDGTIEHKYLGPHQDQKLTKNLRNQGKKINLSLSEMAQFFMKMAQVQCRCRRLWWQTVVRARTRPLGRRGRCPRICCEWRLVGDGPGCAP